MSEGLKNKMRDNPNGLFCRLAFIVVVFYLATAGPVFRDTPAWASEKAEVKKIKVAASIFPLYDFARHVGGDQTEVTNITPSGAEPHDYEPSPKDIATIYGAKLFIYNGNGIDSWGDRIQPELERKGVKVLKISGLMAPVDRPISSLDPHFWLDPINAQREVDLIANALDGIDQNRKEFDQNRDYFNRQLAELDREYVAGLARCELTEMVVSHNAFNYLANRYHLHVFYISGLSPDEEPSPHRMAELVTLARQKQIKYIFFETLVSPKLAATIASEIGAKTMVLNPIEGLTDRENAQGKDYVSLMKENLANLRTALQCQ